MKKLIPFLTLFRQAFANLKNNDPIRMAGATAFFSFFALPAIIIIARNVLSGLFSNYDQTVGRRLFGQLSELISPDSSTQLRDISRHIQSQQSGGWSTSVSLIILLIAATTLFEVIKSSLNQLWNVKVKPRRSVTYFLTSRAVDLGIIIFSGLLFTLSFALDHLLSVQDALAVSEGLAVSSSAVMWVSASGRSLVSIVLLTSWFAVLFKYLPDVQVRWSTVWVGALVTSILITIGEALLTRLLTDQQMEAVHGRSGAITLVLLLVFYCSLIFYFGASFTRQYALWADMAATPSKNAVGYQITEIDKTDG